MSPLKTQPVVNPELRPSWRKLVTMVRPCGFLAQPNFLFSVCFCLQTDITRSVASHPSHRAFSTRLGCIYSDCKSRKTCLLLRRFLTRIWWQQGEGTSHPTSHLRVWSWMKGSTINLSFQMDFFPVTLFMALSGQKCNCSRSREGKRLVITLSGNLRRQWPMNCRRDTINHHRQVYKKELILSSAFNAYLYIDCLRVPRVVNFLHS